MPQNTVFKNNVRTERSKCAEFCLVFDIETQFIVFNIHLNIFYVILRITKKGLRFRCNVYLCVLCVYTGDLCPLLPVSVDLVIRVKESNG